VPARDRALSIDDAVLLLVRAVTLGMGAVAAFAIADLATMAVPVLLLAVVAGTASVVARTRLSGPWVPALESLAAGAVIGFGPPEADVLLPYLIAPAASAGLQFGARYAVVTTVTGAVALLGSSSLREAAAGAQWFIIVIASGLLAAWIRKTRLGEGAQLTEQQAYREAAGLLADLRELTRPLAGGLDPRPLGAGLLADLEAARSIRSATVLVAVGSDRRPVATLGPAGPTLRSEDGLVLPVGMDGRDVAWVVIHDPAQVDDATRHAWQQVASRWALRLDAAALFEEVRELATRAERARLARDMHDGIAQDVAYLGFLADDLLHGDLTDRRDDLVYLRDRIGQLVSELRLSIHDLRDEGATTVGLSAAIAEAARHEAAAAGVAVHLRVADAPTLLSTDVETEIFRIAQEALVNVRRHAGARNLWVSCHTGPGGAVVVIEDDGRGLGQARADSLGMRIMAERAARIGASLSIRPRDGGGTIVEVGLTQARSLGEGLRLT
jgi:signal transduction histidine kinase